MVEMVSIWQGPSVCLLVFSENPKVAFQKTLSEVCMSWSRWRHYFPLADLVWAGKHEYLVLDSLGRAFFVSSGGSQVVISAVKKANTLAFDWLDQRLFWANERGVSAEAQPLPFVFALLFCHEFHHLFFCWPNIISIHQQAGRNRILSKLRRRKMKHWQGLQ